MMFRRKNSPHYIRAAANILGGARHDFPELQLESIEGLKLACDAGVIRPNDLFKYRGSGTIQKPGRVMKYLFPSLTTIQSPKSINQCFTDGAGI